MDKVTIMWSDPGITEGEFTHSLALLCAYTPMPIADIVRGSGIIIARQRQNLLQKWYDDNNSDWALWLDADLKFTQLDIETLWKARDSVHRPIISGVYFNSPFGKTELNSPLIPIIYRISEFDNRMVPVHFDKPGEVIPVDVAGFGCLLLHRSVVAKMATLFENKFFFNETHKTGDQFVGEDVSFFLKVRECGIQPYAHTGVLLDHYKKRPLTFSDYLRLRNL